MREGECHFQHLASAGSLASRKFAGKNKTVLSFRTRVLLVFDVIFIFLIHSKQNQTEEQQAKPKRDFHHTVRKSPLFSPRAAYLQTILRRTL